MTPYADGILAPGDCEAADGHFRVRFERFRRLAAPFPSRCNCRTPRASRRREAASKDAPVRAERAITKRIISPCEMRLSVSRLPPFAAVVFLPLNAKARCGALVRRANRSCLDFWKTVALPQPVRQEKGRFFERPPLDRPLSPPSGEPADSR
jgi:hypothetical protein